MGMRLAQHFTVVAQERLKPGLQYVGEKISTSLDPLRNGRLASDLQQTPTYSKLSPPAYVHLKQISYTPKYIALVTC